MSSPCLVEEFSEKPESEYQPEMLDVLMYLFENYAHDAEQQPNAPAQLQDELQLAGFSDKQISRAFNWLEGLSGLKGEKLPEQGRIQCPFRIYSAAESAMIDVEGQGLLLYLEQIGVLNCEAREAVIDRVVALESKDFDEEQLKWVVLMVLFNQPGAESSYAWMEDFVYDGAPQPEAIH